MSEPPGMEREMSPYSWGLVFPLGHPPIDLALPYTVPYLIIKLLEGRRKMKTIQVNEKLLQAAKHYLEWMDLPVDPDTTKELEEMLAEHPESDWMGAIAPLLSQLALAIVETEKEEAV